VAILTFAVLHSFEGRFGGEEPLDDNRHKLAIPA
jgi:hypothetical protein